MMSELKGKAIVTVVNSFNDVVATLLVDKKVLELSFKELNIREDESVSEFLEGLPFEYLELESKTLYLNGEN